MNLQCRSFRSLLEGGGGGCFGGGVLPRPLKDVAVVGKIRFGVELMFSLVVFSEIPLLFSHNHSLKTKEILFFFLTADFAYNIVPLSLTVRPGRFRRRSTHEPNLTDELSTAKGRCLNQFGTAVLVWGKRVMFDRICRNFVKLSLGSTHDAPSESDVAPVSLQSRTCQFN